MLITICLIFWITGLCRNGFITITVPVAKAYGLQSPTQITIGPMAWFIMAIPADFVTAYVFKYYRTDSVLRVTTTILFFGAMLRLYSTING